MLTQNAVNHNVGDRLARVPYAPVILAVAGAYFFSEWFWKPGFIGGIVPGPYWLFVVFDETVMPVAGAAMLAFVALLVIGLIQLARHQPIWVWLHLFAIAVALLVLSVASAATVPIWVTWHTVHVDSLRIRGHIYQLAAYPWLDTDYGLFECGGLGIVCRSVYLSGDFAGSDTWPGTLTYSSDNNTLSVNAGEQRAIYTFNPP